MLLLYKIVVKIKQPDKPRNNTNEVNVENCRPVGLSVFVAQMTGDQSTQNRCFSCCELWNARYVRFSVGHEQESRLFSPQSTQLYKREVSA